MLINPLRHQQSLFIQQERQQITLVDEDKIVAQLRKPYICGHLINNGLNNYLINKCIGI